VCCRYWAEESPEMRQIVDEMNRSPLVGRWLQTTRITPFGEIRPTDVVPVIASNRSGARAVFPMQWGFAGGRALFNARVETAAVKPMFREAWAGHRCVVPASHYFEWAHAPGRNGKRRAGDKYMLRPSDGAMTWLAGLYRIENGLPAFVVLTREPGEAIRFIHDRMPLVLPGECVNAWISPDGRPEELAASALTDMAYRRLTGGPSGAEAVEQLSML